jgi:hypothetical protein
MLLKVGRHIRPSPHYKLIVGREEGENRFMEGYRNRFDYFFTSSHAGPLVLMDGELKNPADIELAARIVARFGQGREAEQVTITYVPLSGERQEHNVKPFTAEEMPKEWYL